MLQDGVGEGAMCQGAAAELPVGCDAVAEVGGVRAQAGGVRVCPQRCVAPRFLHAGPGHVRECKRAASEVSPVEYSVGQGQVVQALADKAAAAHVDGGATRN